MKTHMPMSLIDVAAIGRDTERPAHEDAPHLHTGQGAAMRRVELGDLARFEGEGGLQAPEPATPYPEKPSSP